MEGSVKLYKPSGERGRPPWMPTASLSPFSKGLDWPILTQIPILEPSSRLQSKKMDCVKNESWFLGLKGMLINTT